MRLPRLICAVALGALPLSGCSQPAEAQLLEPSVATATVEELSGTFYYVTAGTEEADAGVWAFEPGSRPRELVSRSLDLLSAANVSPDGRYLSWPETDLDSGEAQLHIMDLKSEREIDIDIAGIEQYCQEPVWSHDGRLFYQTDPMNTGDSPGTLLDPESGATEQVEPFSGCHPRFAPHSEGADTFAYQTGDADSLMLRSGGEDTAVPSDIVDGKKLVGLTAVARDNAAACVLAVDEGEPWGDVARELTCNLILDTASGEAMTVPTGSTDTGLFPATGGFITRAEGELRLSDADRTDIDTVDEPEEFAEREAFPLAYVP